MGMSQTVTFSQGKPPAWPTVRDLLVGRDYPVQMRMIDGELAFPDEEPPETWRELRVASSQGMVTLRREPDRIEVVTWGNAEGPLLQAWNALVWAFAEAGGGQVASEQGFLNAAAFARKADLPQVLKGQLS